MLGRSFREKDSSSTVVESSRSSTTLSGGHANYKDYERVHRRN